MQKKTMMDDDAIIVVMTIDIVIRYKLDIIFDAELLRLLFTFLYR